MGPCENRSDGNRALVGEEGREGCGQSNNSRLVDMSESLSHLPSTEWLPHGSKNGEKL